MPFTLHLVGILKNVYQCGKGRCADIEISGDVQVVGANPGKVMFTSTIWGRLLLAIERGTVVWSEVRSRERMNAPDTRTEVWSCMLAALEDPKDWRWPGIPQTCKPGEEAITRIPGVR